MTEDEARAAVLVEARSFIGTAFANMGRVKCTRDETGKILDAGGVDCAQFPILVYSNVGIIPLIEEEHYAPDYFMHSGHDRYLERCLEFAREINEPKPGDFALWKLGRQHSHGAIVTAWPWGESPGIIHANNEVGCVIEEYGNGGRLQGRTPKFFTVW